MDWLLDRQFIKADRVVQLTHIDFKGGSVLASAFQHQLVPASLTEVAEFT